jgi:hypothetical protein
VAVAAAAPEEAESEEAWEQPAQQAGQELAPVQVRDMAAWVVSATAVRYRPRARGTRCKRRLQARIRVAGITAHQASAQDTRCKRRLRILKPAATIAERRASLRVDSLRDLKARAMLERIPFQSKSQCSILPPLRGVRFLHRPLSASPRED